MLLSSSRDACLRYQQSGNQKAPSMLPSACHQELRVEHCSWSPGPGLHWVQCTVYAGHSKVATYVGLHMWVNCMSVVMHLWPSRCQQQLRQASTAVFVAGRPQRQLRQQGGYGTPCVEQRFCCIGTLCGVAAAAPATLLFESLLQRFENKHGTRTFDVPSLSLHGWNRESRPS